MSKTSERKEFKDIVTKSIHDCKKIVWQSYNGIKSETEINQKVDLYLYTVYQSVCVDFNLDYEYYIKNMKYSLSVAFMSDLINTVQLFLIEYEKIPKEKGVGSEYVDEIIKCINKFIKKPLYINYNNIPKL